MTVVFETHLSLTRFICVTMGLELSIGAEWELNGNLRLYTLPFLPDWLLMGPRRQPQLLWSCDCSHRAMLRRQHPQPSSLSWSPYILPTSSTVSQSLRGIQVLLRAEHSVVTNWFSASCTVICLHSPHLALGCLAFEGSRLSSTLWEADKTTWSSGYRAVLQAQWAPSLSHLTVHLWTQQREGQGLQSVEETNWRISSSFYLRHAYKVL